MQRVADPAPVLPPPPEGLVEANGELPAAVVVLDPLAVTDIWRSYIWYVSIGIHVNIVEPHGVKRNNRENIRDDDPQKERIQHISRAQRH